MTESQVRRPALIWVVSLFTIGQQLLLVFYIGLFLINKQQLPADLMTYFEQMGMINIIVSLMLSALYLVGTVLLIRLKALGCYMISLAVVAGIVLHIWYVLTGQIGTAADSGRFLQGLIDLAIAFLIIVYLWRLKGRGVLS